VKGVNIADPAFAHDKAKPEGFRGGIFRFGPLLGAEQLGTSVYELPPRQSICPYHYEYGEEEWLLVLEDDRLCGIRTGVDLRRLVSSVTLSLSQREP
jgi:uncharacterized cupin superfamily protein